jgi:hypothetical protein
VSVLQVQLKPVQVAVLTENAVQEVASLEILTFMVLEHVIPVVSGGAVPCLDRVQPAHVQPVLIVLVFPLQILVEVINVALRLIVVEHQ